MKARMLTRSPTWALLLLMVALVSIPSAAVAQDRPLLWGADEEGGAPYMFKDAKTGKYVGFEAELIEALEAELGRKIVFKQYGFKELTQGLKRGDFDFALCGLEVTPDRIAQVRFTRPYYIYRLQLVARADDNRFQSVDEAIAAGVQFGTMDNTAAHRLLLSEGVEPTIYDGPVEAYSDLQAERIDAVLLDLPIALYYALPKKELKFVGEAIAPGQYAIAFRKEDDALASQFDAALGRLIDRGELQRIYTNWRLWNDDQLQLAQLGPPDVLSNVARELTFDRYFPLLLKGALVTVEITFMSMILAVALGLPIAMARLYGAPPLKLLATLYVEFFRGIPLLFLLYFLYYGLPWHFPAMTAAVLGFGLNYAAYESEIYRAGISAVPVGQWEAAESLGMSKATTFRRIILPQAVRNILPPMTNDFIALFKDTSLVSVIAVLDLSKQYQIMTRSGGNIVRIGLVTAILYLMMSVPLGYLSRYLEHRWHGGK